MGLLSLLLGAGLVASVIAKQCKNITVPVSNCLKIPQFRSHIQVEIMARQGIFNVPEIMTPVEVTAFVQNFTSIQNGTNYTMETLLDYQTVTGSYNISAKFCQPDNESGANPVVQVLSHGIG